MSSDSIRVYAPATVANLGSGFDLMGLAIRTIADEIIVTRSDSTELLIEEITGDDGRLPKTPADNTCTVAIQSLLNKLNSRQGFRIRIHKKIGFNSGLGSSASSAVAGAYAVNCLLGNPYTRTELIPFALEGEYIASRGYHADNIAPCLLGGITLITETNPLRVTMLSFDPNLFLVVLYQYIPISTASARNILPAQYERGSLIRQSARIASLVVGLERNDTAAIGFGLEDELATPYRKMLIPFFDNLQTIAMENGAIGFNISGSGPSVFGLFKSEKSALPVIEKWKSFMQNEKKPFEIYSSLINKTGVRAD